LKKLLSLKIRWVEADGDYISIAFWYDKVKRYIKQRN
jgi:hypothetical protein